VYQTSIYLIVRESGSIGIRCRRTSNNERDAPIERYRRIEGIEEVIGLARLHSIERRSLETTWQIDDLSMIVKSVEKAVSYRGDRTHIETSCWQTY